MATERVRKTTFNAIANILQLLVSGIAGLIVMRVLLLFLGSSYNGLNSTVAQLMTILVLVSSSFTTASLISMYKPYNQDDWQQLNLIISTSRRVYRFIGLGVLLVGLVACFVYAHLITSDIPLETIFVVLLLSLVSTVFNISVVNTYRLVFQVSQTEYIITAISTCYTVVVSIVACIAIVETENIIVVRFCYMVLEIASGFVIRHFARKQFNNMSFIKEYDYSLVKGTKDVFASALTGVFYRSSPTLFLASIVGTAATSVYYVYDSIVSLVRSVVQVFINAPKNALGQVIHEGDTNKTTHIFYQYEYITFLAASVLFSVTFAVIFPFIRLYTADVTGADYLVQYIPIMLVLIAFIEIIHIPSGLLIQLSGHFKMAKNIQYVALAALIVMMVVLGSTFGLLGILLSVLGTAVLLTIMEVFCARKKILSVSLGSFLKLFFTHFLLFLVIGLFESVLMDMLIDSYISFALWSAICLIANGTLFAFLGKILFIDGFGFIQNWTKEIVSKVVNKLPLRSRNK